MEKKLALITGATSGIGQATAKLFASRHINLILCGRRKERLEMLEKELGQSVDVDILAFDISQPHEVKSAFLSIKEQVPHIDILINNAGNAHGLGPIDKGDMNDFEKMIDTNLKGLLYVSQEIIPSMVKKKSGHIINLGSIAGKEVYPKGNVYCATKSAVDALSKAMRIDLAEHQIKVSNINPGLVETEFSLVRFKGNQELAKKTYQGFTPLTPFDIADLIYFIISRPVHVNLADCLILPLAQPCATTVIRESTREG
ncbi:MAG: NAD(P)-dependent oxidoreductase [Bdellovibrionales bacterium RIFOXYB1_FULL_37_110]|nr:MAG: NAD(P)-dependent oxidoreductase [Bdellovibrionales bacterium RIFOXYA1_FULL_38_20]OFZ48624.1 MAG: NAD(P)-dependent oxidoreductase [Bdellovibrionales bacterium RIFOXYC1_FULL_37_79]OFZ58433.1 MAG: NAD(P)-dependent oxidoreductase [Bdellovibrionales bacterium RIFOXYB1_FULL_37_110]OFZ61477.1 MAG: NAD(P)-dependent oxidoreductase [Bdellovibrionales bacterium RIFOXYD1_FULL_36_51]